MITRREALERLRSVVLRSTEFDNFECHYGSRLGTCCTSNHCIACEAWRILNDRDPMWYVAEPSGPEY